MNYSKIAGVGSYLPARIVSNSALEERVDTSDEWIRSRTGIVQRHIAAEDQSSCDLAEQAARNAIIAAGISVDEIDLIIVATTTPDLFFPSTACLLQQRLGLHGCAAFDVQAVCTGFIYALGIADKFIRTGAAQCALIVGADIMSRLVDWQDRSTCILFGDGAGAAIVKADKAQGILSTCLHADGSFQQLLQVPYGIGNRKQDNSAPYISMQGNKVFHVAVKKLVSIVDEALIAHTMSIEDIDWLIPHQANIRIINAVAKKLALPIEKVILTIQKHGNTSAASIPIAFDSAIKDGRIERGDMLMLEAFGGGFTWGSALIRY